MALVNSFRQQHFFLLLFTFSILAAAILLLSLREHFHHELFLELGDHQSIVYHIGKTKEELRAIEHHLLLGNLRKKLGTSDTEVPAGMSSADRFNYSVSIHAVRDNIGDMLRLRQETDGRDNFTLKIERQIDQLLGSATGLETNQPSGFDESRLRIEGLLLSLAQLEGLHGMRIKALYQRHDEVTRRDTSLLILMVSILALLSYLSIAWTMGRVRAMLDEQHAMARELERKNTELERFSYTVSHDLKSPLVTIKNFIGMLERNVRADDRRKVFKDLEHISSAADDMAALLEGLLELSRIGRIVGPPQSGRLNDLVERAVEKLRAKIEARGVDLEIEAGMPDYWGDSLRLQEVLQNLIENSVKFMGDQPAPLIRIGARQQGDEVVCSVSDNGIGIEPQYKTRVFNLFERLDQKVEGTGIGLALVQRIIEAHHGKIWIEPNTDGGCTVSFALPLPAANSETA